MPGFATQIFEKSSDFCAYPKAAAFLFYIQLSRHLVVIAGVGGVVHDILLASMKTTMQRWDKWLRRRFRCYIWKQWKLSKTRVKNLMKLGMPQWQAYRNGNSRKGYWAIAGSGILTKAIANKRLAEAGYFEIQTYYESLHLYD